MGQDGVVFRGRGLTKVYKMGEVRVHALKGVDLDIFRGEFVVLLGPSGSGKSTLLNILGGLDTASSGTVTYEGWDLTKATERELTEYRRYHVGFVFQFYNLIPSLTAAENVAAVTDIARAPMEPSEALGIVGLGERLNHFPSQLSGGEQQRVAIARAIAKNPSVLLCDEPTGFTKISALGVEEQRVLVISDIISPFEEWGRLGDGYRVEARFVLWKDEDVLRMPESALFRHADGWAAFVIEGGRARLRKVSLGHRSGLTAEVVSGIDAGEKVITHPDDAIEDGARVRLRKSSRRQIARSNSNRAKRLYINHGRDWPPRIQARCRPIPHDFFEVTAVNPE